MENLLLSFDELEEIAINNGVNVVGVTKAKFLDSSLFKKWQDSGGAGELEYLKKDPNFYFNPFNLMQNAESVILFLFFYEDSSYKLLNCPDGYGRVARFAYGKNYHKIIKKKLTTIAEDMSDKLKSDNFKFRVFVDAVPLSERNFAKEAGLGFIGNSSMLVNPDYGSYFFIGEIVTNVKIYDLPKKTPINSNCEFCNRCQKSCVNKVKNEGFFNVNKCTSYLTIEKKGILKRDEWKFIGDWIFGCDLCSINCPYNKKGKLIGNKLDLGFSITRNGLLDIKEVLNIQDEDEFLKRYAGTSFMRAKRENIIRNSLIVLANQKNIKFLDIIEKLSNNDESEVIRHTAGDVFFYLKEFSK